VAIVGFGPVALAVTPSFTASRIERNDQYARERFVSLQHAVERVADANPAQLCDGAIVKQNYSGRLFSEEDWQRITGNYVKQDGYFFMIYCQEQGGYIIHAMPARRGEDGRRLFCVDESGKIGCDMGSNLSRHLCLPCTQ